MSTAELVKILSVIIATCLNFTFPCRFTYEIAPTFTLMENLVLDHMISKVGWEGGDGVLAPGGTISNLYALLLARYKFDPKVKTDGVHLHSFVVFTSEHVSDLYYYLHICERFTVYEHNTPCVYTTYCYCYIQMHIPYPSTHTKRKIARWA